MELQALKNLETSIDRSQVEVDEIKALIADIRKLCEKILDKLD